MNQFPLWRWHFTIYILQLAYFHWRAGGYIRSNALSETRLRQCGFRAGAHRTWWTSMMANKVSELSMSAEPVSDLCSDCIQPLRISHESYWFVVCKSLSNSWVQGKSKYFLISLYPLQLNHCCTPNIRHFSDRYVTLTKVLRRFVYICNL